MSIEDQIIALDNSEEYQKLTRYYGTESFFNTLCIARKELIHSQFISWLLNPNSNHALGYFPLRKFLQMIAKISRLDVNKSKLNTYYFQKFMVQDYKIIGTTEINTEVCAEIEKKKGRIDILVNIPISFDGKKKKLPIVIENKVFSAEHDRQTELYKEWILNKCKNEPEEYYDPIFVFLSIKNLSEVKCDSPDYLKVNYQNLLDYVLEPCMLRESSAEGNLMIKNYIRCLSIGRINFDDKSERKQIKEKIMAMSNEEKELLVNFYNKNRDLFDSVIKLLSDNEDINEEVRDSMKKVVDGISKYKFDGNEYYMGPCALAVVKKYAEDNREVNLKKLQDIFGKKVVKSVTDDNVKKLNGQKRYSAKYDGDGNIKIDDPETVISLADGDKVVVSNQWYKNKNFPKFIEDARKVGMNIEAC